MDKMRLLGKISIIHHFFWITVIFVALTTRVLAEESSEETSQDYSSEASRTIHNKNINRPCRSIFRRPATCVSLRDCAPLAKLLREFPSIGWSVIRASICSATVSPNHLHARAFVCCPNSAASGSSSSEVNNITSSTTASPSTTTSSSTNVAVKPLEPPRCGFSDKPHDRVVGGNPSAVGAWPWLAALGYGISPKYVVFRCGGALISSRHVATAAHCVDGFDDLQIVRLGAHKLNTNDQDDSRHVDVVIEKKIVHPDFDETTLENDIAILKLDRDVEFTDIVHPICLPVSNDLRNSSFVNKYPFVAGWGATSDGGPGSDVVREVQVPVVDNDKCKENYSRVKNTVVDERVLCAGYAQGGKDACQGDSGGPLMYPQRTTWYLIGIVSGGYRCAKPGYPGIYTRVTNFLDFIESNLN